MKNNKNRIKSLENSEVENFMDEITRIVGFHLVGDKYTSYDLDKIIEKTECIVTEWQQADDQESLKFENMDLENCIRDLEDTVDQLTSQIDDIKDENFNLHGETARLQMKIDELKEYKSMYKGLCK